MFSVPTVRRYDLTCAVAVNAAVSSDSQVHTYMPLLKAVRYAKTDVAFAAKYSVLCVCFSVNAHNTASVFL